ncbi:MAG: phosphate/phosphite/phosphonate ABC transporter substrate-binding protein [Chloroflexi bacterium]|nr:MAG: phosphate/phosphite/phosphonate ABC transporter substrate-binding protein [Chloroflexota bacterium]
MARSVYQWGLGAVLVVVTVLGLAAVWSSVKLARAEELPYIDLNQQEPLSSVAQAEIVPLRVAVAAVISPQGTFESYSALASYLSSKIGRPVELVQRRTYAEVNELVENNKVDVAFVCTSAYIIGNRDFGMELLVAPQVDGATTYQSWLIVPADSPAQNLSDLRGKTFAFTDPWSNSGRVFPTAMVKDLGETPETFFGRTFYTYSHDDAIRAVANGVADGAAVDSLVYQYAVAREPELGNKTKIIHRSPAFGIPPVVTSPHLRPQTKAELQSILLDMTNDPAGQAALDVLDIDRFVLTSDTQYNSARELEEKVGLLELK